MNFIFCKLKNLKKHEREAGRHGRQGEETSDETARGGNEFGHDAKENPANGPRLYCYAHGV